MSKVFLASLALILTGSLTLAVCPTATVVRPVSYPSYTPYYSPYIVRKVVTPVIVKEVVKQVYTPVAVYAPFPVAIPYYGAVYNPSMPTSMPGADTGITPTGGLAEVLVELRKLNSRIDALERKRPTDPFAPAPLVKPSGATEIRPGATATPRDGALAIFTNKCAACHDATVSATKGGGLTLLEKGVLSKLTDKQARKVMTTSYNGKMPPKSSGIAALTDEEVSSIVNHLDK